MTNNTLIIDAASVYKSCFYGVSDAKDDEYIKSIYSFFYLINNIQKTNEYTDTIFLFDGIENENLPKSFFTNINKIITTLKDKNINLAVFGDYTAACDCNESLENKNNSDSNIDNLLNRINFRKCAASIMQSIDGSINILTADRLFASFVDSSTKLLLLTHSSKESHVLEINEDNFDAIFSIAKKYMNSLLVLTNDDVFEDSKIGEKTAISLIKKYENIENIYEHIGEIGERVQKLLLAKKDMILHLNSFINGAKIPETNEFISLTKDNIISLNNSNDNFISIIESILAKLSNTDTGNSSTKSAGKYKQSSTSPFVNVNDINDASDIDAIFNKENKDSMFSEHVQKDASGSDKNLEADAPKKDYSNLPKLQTELITDASKLQDIVASAKVYCKKNKEAFVGYFLLQDKSLADDLIGLSICFDESKAYFIKKNDEITAKRIGEFLEELSKDCRLSVYDIKNTYYLYTPYEIDNKKEYGNFDILIGAYLINPNKSDTTITDIVSEYLPGLNVKSYKDVFDKHTLKELLEVPTQLTFDFCMDASDDSSKKKKTRKMSKSFEGENLIDTPDKALTQMVLFACENARVAFLSASEIENKLKSINMFGLMKDIEMPLSYVLFAMQKEGIICLKEELEKYSQKLAVRIEELEKEIYNLSGEEFNINSPKQLGVILFEKMNLPGAKKTKTGYSTSAEVLEELAPDHEIVKYILEYRALSKLKSTYADGLIDYIESDNRIHTVYNQTITATGRISSSEPNLQNIPMRTELGREIRKVFVPKKGFVFADADYSQVELRILADMSGDEELIEDYKNGKDIHRSTASKVFHTPFDEVTDIQRRNAKAVNFGIVYGISAFGLAADLGISRAEAKSYMEEYFKMYPNVKKYQEDAINFAKENGYSITKLGRRRPIPELSDKNFMRRQFGERIAMNAPIQGTAADIMKIAMINVFKEMREKNLKSRLILQIHDELLIETAEDEVEVVKELLTRNMINAGNLKVGLIAECKIGKDFYEAK